MCRRLGGIGRENAIAHKTQYSLILSTSCGKNIKGKKTKSRIDEREADSAGDSGERETKRNRRWSREKNAA